MSSGLLGPPTPQTLSPSSKSLNEIYDEQRKKHYAATPSAKAEIVYKDRRAGYLFKIAVYASILFFILSNRLAFTTLNKIIATFVSSMPNLIVDEYDTPTLKGNLIHTAIFFIIIMCLLFFT